MADFAARVSFGFAAFCGTLLQLSCTSIENHENLTLALSNKYHTIRMPRHCLEALAPLSKDTYTIRNRRRWTTRQHSTQTNHRSQMCEIAEWRGQAFITLEKYTLHWDNIPHACTPFAVVPAQIPFFSLIVCFVLVIRKIRTFYYVDCSLRGVVVRPTCGDFLKGRHSTWVHSYETYAAMKHITPSENTGKLTCVEILPCICLVLTCGYITLSLMTTQKTCTVVDGFKVTRLKVLAKTTVREL